MEVDSDGRRTCTTSRLDMMACSLPEDASEHCELLRLELTLTEYSQKVKEDVSPRIIQGRIDMLHSIRACFMG